MKNRIKILSVLAFSLFFTGCSNVLGPLTSPKGYIKEIGHTALHRYRHFAISLNDGSIFLVGGSYDYRAYELYRLKHPQNFPDKKFQKSQSFHYSEIYNPKMNKSEFVHSRYSYLVNEAEMTPLKDGRILFTGGIERRCELLVGETICGTDQGAAEIFDPEARSFKLIHGLASAREYHSSVLIGNGQAIIIGGSRRGAGLFSTVDKFDPVTERFMTVGNLHTVRHHHNVVQLDNGQILVIGGAGLEKDDYDKNTNHKYCVLDCVMDEVELYDPETNQSKIVGRLNAGRMDAVVEKMKDGRVIILGGQGEAGFESSVEVYDPETNTSTTVGDIPVYGYPFVHEAVSLPDGRVAIFTIKDVWLFNPQNNELQTLDRLIVSRQLYAVAPGPEGKVYIVGGTSVLQKGEPTDHNLVQIFSAEKE